MKFNLYKASDYDFVETVEVNSIEDLKQIQDRYGRMEGGRFKARALVVDCFSYFYKGIEERESPSITIYDDYME